jgi:hypothetical protein
MKAGMHIVTHDAISTANFTGPCHQKTCLEQTHFRKTETTRNHPHQNVLVTWTQVKTLLKQQTSHIYKAILKPIWTFGIHL